MSRKKITNIDLHSKFRRIKKSMFTAPENYLDYVSRTDEKTRLQIEIASAYKKGELPISDKGGSKILDLGCGVGTNTEFLSAMFEEHDVFAIDKMQNMINFAENNLIDLSRNIILEHSHFEDFSRKKFDFILCSHVLQYIDSDLGVFLRKALDQLNAGGELWIVLQEELGINEVVTHIAPLLSYPNGHLVNWFTHARVREVLLSQNVEIRSKILHSGFNIKGALEDPLNSGIMKFILLDSLKADEEEAINTLKELLTRLSRKEIVRHDVGITKVRKI